MSSNSLTANDRARIEAQRQIAIHQAWLKLDPSERLQLYLDAERRAQYWSSQFQDRVTDFVLPENLG